MAERLLYSTSRDYAYTPDQIRKAVRKSYPDVVPTETASPGFTLRGYNLAEGVTLLDKETPSNGMPGRTLIMLIGEESPMGEVEKAINAALMKNKA